jgi:hypothetical protein
MLAQLFLFSSKLCRMIPEGAGKAKFYPGNALVKDKLYNLDKKVNNLFYHLCINYLLNRFLRFGHSVGFKEQRIRGAWLKAKAVD